MSEHASREVVDSPSIDSGETTDTRSWARDGVKCDREGGHPMDCFLNKESRTPYIVETREAINDMKESYKLALTELRFDELMKEEEDVSWLATLALDIASGYLMGLVTKAVARVKANAFTRVTAQMLDTRLAGGDVSRAQRAAFTALSNLSDASINSWTKLAFDAGQKGVQKAMKQSHNVDLESEKTATVTYIQSLQASAETGFSTFRNRASANTTDSELIALWEAVTTAPRDLVTFKALLGEKLGRFKKSGVLDIGRKEARDTTISPSPAVLRDTRVVWVVHPDGTKELFYESQDGEDDPSVFHPGDPGTSWMPESKKPLEFGPRQPRGGRRIDRRVPAEFRDVAIEASRQRWGDVPTHDIYNIQGKKAAQTNLNSYWFGDDDASPASADATSTAPLTNWRSSVSPDARTTTAAAPSGVDPSSVPSVLWRPDLLPAQ